MRGLGATFLGSAADDAVLKPAKPGEFYFNSTTRELKFDVTGDGKVDHVIGLPQGEIIANSFLL